MRRQLADQHFDTKKARREEKLEKVQKWNSQSTKLLLTVGSFWNKSKSLDKYARCSILSTVTAIGGSLLWHSRMRSAKRNSKKSKNGIHNQPNCGLLLATVQLKASLWTSMQDVACSQLWRQLADQHFDTQTSEARKEIWKSPKMEFTINQTVAYCWQLCN